MPGTPWTELSGTTPAWQDGTSIVPDESDFYVDFLFEGVGSASATVAWSGVEMEADPSGFQEGMEDPAGGLVDFLFGAFALTQPDMKEHPTPSWTEKVL